MTKMTKGLLSGLLCLVLCLSCFFAACGTHVALCQYVRRQAAFCRTARQPRHATLTLHHTSRYQNYADRLLDLIRL